MRLPDRPAWRRLIALTAGAASVFAFAPFGLFWLLPLACLLLFLLVQRAESPREAALAGLFYGGGLFGGGVSWVFVSLSVFGGMPWWLAGPATVAYCLLLALFPAAAGWLSKRLAPAGGRRGMLAFAGSMAAVDWLRSWIFTGFPWLALGYSQSPPSPLAGYAPLLGVFGISLLVAGLGALLSRPRSGIIALAIVAAGGFGLRQVAWTEAAGEPVSVALIQGNVAQDIKFDPEHFIATLRLYRDLIAAHPARLTLLPETALPAFIDQLPPAYLEELRALAQRRDGDLVIGTLTGQYDGQYFNSAYSLGHSPSQIYSKHHLVPFGEFIPPGFAWFMARANIPMSSFTPGPAGQAPLAVGGLNLAVDICYEDVFGAEIIRPLPAAGVLANLSNTAWFGRSLAQPQHLQIAQLRAAETGRPMLRATNTGMTAIIDADGSLRRVLPPFETAVLEDEVRAHIGSTPYVALGDWPALALIALTLLGARWRRPR
ncbi:apolipoprotein N-acyltransferase [Azonexus sp. R2A61]|uniref:apolipoprotein N-acyltransferase n=1 Tax=Azonexus sp. R2A61 TaxID=2744443 RepID=UPI001F20FA2A|nr:apolipoprotein N-acyltransferase [Azonexus sp. R2A61]